MEPSPYEIVDAATQPHGFMSHHVDNLNQIRVRKSFFGGKYYLEAEISGAGHGGMRGTTTHLRISDATFPTQKGAETYATSQWDAFQNHYVRVDLHSTDQAEVQRQMNASQEGKTENEPSIDQAFRFKHVHSGNILDPVDQTRSHFVQNQPWVKKAARRIFGW